MSWFVYFVYSLWNSVGTGFKFSNSGTGFTVDATLGWILSCSGELKSASHSLTFWDCVGGRACSSGWRDSSVWKERMKLSKHCCEFFVDHVYKENWEMFF